MKTDFINPFINAADMVLSAEARLTSTKGTVSAQEGDYITNDVTLYMGVTGALEGQVFYGLSKSTLFNFVSIMLGQPSQALSPIVNSAISELGNMINGRAGMALELLGYRCKITPPSLIIRKNVRISTLAIKRINIPLNTTKGGIDICLGLRAKSEKK